MMTESSGILARSEEMMASFYYIHGDVGASPMAMPYWKSADGAALSFDAVALRWQPSGLLRNQLMATANPRQYTGLVVGDTCFAGNRRH